MLVEWFKGPFDGVGESLFMSEMNLVVVAVGLRSSSEDEEDGEVFKMFGFEQTTESIALIVAPKVEAYIMTVHGKT